MNPADYETAIRHTRTRIALVTGSDELRDILDKPFAAWRVFLHPSQHKVACRPSCSGPARPGSPVPAQKYKHVVLAQNLRTYEQCEAAERKGRGSALPVVARPPVWGAVEEFTARPASDGLRTYLGTCAEAAELLERTGPRYRHVVVDEAQDLHPAQ